MKKIISIIAAAAMMCAAVSPVFAANTESGNPDVFINGTEIIFPDQDAVIVDGRTLVPARGVFQAMGANVSWDEEQRKVQIKSADDNTWVDLIIDNPTMTVYDRSGLFAALLAGQDFIAPKTDVTLDVAPQIINDRTMIPLRAISEAIDADVQWDEEAYAVNITSKDAAANEKGDGKPEFSLSASAETVGEGETVDVFINLTNLPQNTYVSSVTAVLKYNKENFEFVSTSLVNGDTVVENALGVDNTDYDDDSMKAVYITIDAENAAKTDGKVMKLTFRSINGKEGSFSMPLSYSSGVGHSESLFAASLDFENTPEKTYSGDSLYVDTTPVTVNAGK